MLAASRRRAGSLRRNFMGYTTHRGTAVIGLGMSSISSVATAYAQNAKELPAEK